MVKIKPEEISAILREQLSNFNANADLHEIGTVLQIGDGIGLLTKKSKIILTDRSQQRLQARLELVPGQHVLFRAHDHRMIRPRDVVPDQQLFVKFFSRP